MSEIECRITSGSGRVSVKAPTLKECILQYNIGVAETQSNEHLGIGCSLCSPGRIERIKAGQPEDVWAHLNIEHYLLERLIESINAVADLNAFHIEHHKRRGVDNQHNHEEMVEVL